MLLLLLLMMMIRDAGVLLYPQLFCVVASVSH